MFADIVVICSSEMVLRWLSGSGMAVWTTSAEGTVACRSVRFADWDGGGEGGEAARAQEGREAELVGGAGGVRG